MTRYLILTKTGDEAYELFDYADAHSATQAIRKALDGKPIENGVYVAVPEANWTELPVALQAPAPRLVIGGIVEEPQLPLEPAEV